MIKIQINPGEEVMETISKELQKQDIREGAIVSVVGAVDECCISTMPKQDAKKDILTEYLYAEFATPLMGFVDDVEFYCDGKVIQVRSASRLGYSDLGVNRKRIEEIRAAFQK